MIMETVNLWFVVKLFFLFALTIYLIFAAVVVRQVYLMTETIKVGFEFPVRVVAWLHLFAAVGVFLIALFTL